MACKVLNTLCFLASDKDSESCGNTSRPSNRVSTQKRKASTNRDSPRKRPRVDNEPTEVEVQVIVTMGTKRKATSDGQVPSKKQRHHSNNTCTDDPSELPVVALTGRGSKRKAPTPAGAPSKKLRGENTNTGESAERAAQTGLKKASAEQLPAAQTPGTSKAESGCDVSPSPTGPSASRQNNGCLTFPGKTSRADFEAKYLQLNKLGEGGFGSVYAGIRKTDNLLVAIKHIPQADVERQPAVLHGVTYMVPTEVLLLHKVAGPESVGKTAVVSLLDWYDLEQEVLLIMERPVPAVDLLKYLENNNSLLEEDTAKIIMKQLVEAAIHIHSKGVFHRDIKLENVLIQTTSDGLRVRVIDFGCGCSVRMTPFREFAGTSAFAPPEFYMWRMYQAGPTTVWQLGALLYEITGGYQKFETTKILRKGIKFSKQLSQDCLDLLHRCLEMNSHNRITLEEMLLHPWFSDT